MGEPAVGIDLGTTFSCIAAVKDGKPQVIFNQQGNYVTPSWVTFNDNEILVGEPAKIAAAVNPRNGIFMAKRLIGRHYEDWHEEYSADKSKWPFNIVNVAGKPYYHVFFQGRQQNISPEQVSSYVLKELKKSAEEVLQQPVKNAVISVPANFNYAQREATEEAAKMAGFNVLRLCSEPAMAGIMHEPLQHKSGKMILLVFDCGGGTTDVAILSISKDGAYDIMATAGNMSLGGETITDRLVTYFLQKLLEETGQDYSENEEAVRRLRKVCEEAKCQLSFSESFTVSFECQCETKLWKYTRPRFNELMADIFEKMIEPIAEAIAGAGIEMNQVDEVLLAGGTSRILHLQNRLAIYFQGKPIRKSVNPEQAIALGAAVMASVLSGDDSALLGKRQLFEVAPLSVKLSLSHNELFVLIPRGTKLPVSVTKTFFNAFDDQTVVIWEVYEGERLLSSDCASGYLGELRLSGFKKARRHHLRFSVTCDVSASGVMKVIVVEPISGATASLQLMSKNRQRNSRNVVQMVEDAEKNYMTDAIHQSRIMEMRNFEDLVYKRKHEIEDGKLVQTNKRSLDTCNEALLWIKNSKDASSSEIKHRRMQFEEVHWK